MAEAAHVREVKPKTRDGSDSNGRVYVPREWLGEKVLALVGVEDEDIEELDDGTRIVCEAADFDRPTPYRSGTGAAIFIPGEHIGDTCIVLLHPTSFAMEATDEK